MFRKLFLLLIPASLIFGIMSNDLSAQNTKIKRWAVGSGGTVAASDNTGSKSSGIIGQLAIGKIVTDNLVPNKIIKNIYQGFWIPEIVATSSVEIRSDQSDNLKLRNYPNPFSISTSIKYLNPAPSYVTIRIFDQSGRIVKNLYEGRQEIGENEVGWNGKDEAEQDLVSGVYIYEIHFKPIDFVGQYAFEEYSVRSSMILSK